MDLTILLADRNKHIPGWATDPLARSRFHRNESEIPRYHGIEREFAGEAKRITAKYAAGKSTRHEAMKEFKGLLHKAETETFIAGKRASGVKSLYVSPAEQKMLNGRHSRNMRYFSNFLNDISSKRCIMPIDRRADMYAQSLWSLYNRGQVGIDWSDPNPDTRYIWVMDFEAEHCIDCLEKYRLSNLQNGFTYDELVELGFPGENCACMTRCRCHIHPIGKGKPPSDKPGPAAEVLERLLGGNKQPVSLQVAGLPHVKIEPMVVAQDLAALGTIPKQENYLAALPTVLESVLKYPREIIPIGETKVYEGTEGSRVTMARNDTGIWMIVHLEVGYANKH